MKIAYFLDFPGGIGGAGKVLLTQAYIMSKRGNEVFVVIPNDENGGHAHELDEISEKYALRTITAFYPVAATLEEIDIMASLESYDAILQLLLKEKVGLIHSTQINVAVELASRKLGIPHLMNIYQTDPETFDIHWLDIYPHYHSADSEFFCKRWGEGLHIPSKCIRVAYESGCRRTKAKEGGMSFPLQVISIGILTDRKNQLEIIKFIWKCKQSGLRVALIILGNHDTSYGEECKRFVEKYHLEKEIAFKGVVLNIEDYLAQSDLMIVPSTVESYPGVIVESMANRTPVIATPIAGIPELLKDGYNGFLTKGFTYEDIHETFERFLSYKEDGKIQDIVDHAYQTYQENHSYEAAGAGLESYYGWILTNYDKQSPCMQMDEVKHIFDKFMKEKRWKEASRDARRDLWFLYHLDKEFSTGRPKKITIWGAGLFGKIAFGWLDILGLQDRFVGFLDTYKTGTYLDYPILENKERTVRDCDVTLVAVGDTGGCLEIMKYLEKFGKKKNIDYFTVSHATMRI